MACLLGFVVTIFLYNTCTRTVKLEPYNIGEIVSLINIIPADSLAENAARTSAGMILTQKAGLFKVSHYACLNPLLISYFGFKMLH